MFNLQGSEIIVILLLALVVLGPEKLPGAIRRFTRTYAELKKMSTGFQTELKSALDEPMKEMRETADLLKETADPNRLIAEAEAEEDLEADARHAVDDAELADAELEDDALDEDHELEDDDHVDDDRLDDADDELDAVEEVDDLDRDVGQTDDAGDELVDDELGSTRDGDDGERGEPARPARPAASRSPAGTSGNGGPPDTSEQAAQEAFSKERAVHARAVAGASQMASTEAGDDDLIPVPTDASQAPHDEWDDPVDEEASA